MKQYVVIPGRHHVLTQFHEQYVRDISSGASSTKGGRSLAGQELQFIWAVTSANHSNTRRNPFTANRREAAIERFGAAADIAPLVFHINDIGQTDRFADHVLKQISVQSEGGLELTPENTVIWTSTPEVIAMYEQLGFDILPAELGDNGEFITSRPWDVLLDIIEQNSCEVTNLHPASKSLIERYDLTKTLQRIFSDPLIGEEGDITETRNYEVYRQAFEEGAARKFEQIKDYIVPGRIVDIGCATGETVKLLNDSPDLFESDIYGVEVARPLLTICRQRQENGEFSNENTFFYQRNIMSEALFPPSTVDTSISMALTHEIESYLGHDQLQAFMQQIYEQTREGGVWINFDVCAPNNRKQIVYAKFKTDDGLFDEQPFAEFQTTIELRDYLNELSTYSRFLRFARDFRAEEGDTISYEIPEVDGEKLIKITKADLADFLAKKDYTENWQSEMHERFCFYEFADYAAAAEVAGFTIDADSKPIVNDWLMENRFMNSTTIYTEPNLESQTIDSLETNCVLIARKV